MKLSNDHERAIASANKKLKDLQDQQEAAVRNHAESLKAKAAEKDAAVQHQADQLARLHLQLEDEAKEREQEAARVRDALAAEFATKQAELNRVQAFKVREHRKLIRTIEEKHGDAKKVLDDAIQAAIAPGNYQLEQLECCICMDEVPVVRGITCNSRHFLCDDCFTGHVNAIATRDERLALGSDVPCPIPKCESRNFSTQEIAEHCSAESFRALETLREQLVEKQVNAAADKRIQDEVTREVERLAKMTQLERDVDEARKFIVDEILSVCADGLVGVFYSLIS